MVQRKVSNKLGIYPDHVKSDKLLVNLKPCSFQHQDGKNRGADLRKKMKKSRSFKHQDFESLWSPRLRREVPQPGKPPPLDVPATTAAAATAPKKQSPAKALEVSPNYMKSTSSSAAKKEHPQVSYRASQTSPDKSPCRKNSTNSKLSSLSVYKPAKTLARTSSLKLVRTLTKSPSFKPARASTRKCSPVVLCENLEVQRATCSSTLKDSKFPAYLPLNPGGTEIEGTSVMKVCPYNYCSLNGHHHPRPPPLKCFLSARRHMLKTRKSIKLGCLSPRQTRSSRNSMKDNDDGSVAFDAEPPIQELDLCNSAINPVIQEENTDFFIEIYAEENKNSIATISANKHKRDDHDKTDAGAGDIMSTIQDRDETTAENVDGKLVEILSDAPTCSEIDFEDNLNQNNDVISTEMDILGYFPHEDQNVELTKELNPLNFNEEETITKCFRKQDDLMAERPPSIQHDELDSEGSDMEWEAGRFAATYLDEEVKYSTEASSKSDMEVGSLEVDNHTSYDEQGCHFEEIMDDEVVQEPLNLDEKDVSSETLFVGMYSKSDGYSHNLESDEPIQVSKDQTHPQVSPVYDAFNEPTTEERDAVSEPDGFSMNPCSHVEESIKDPRIANEDKSRVFKADDGIVIKGFQVAYDELTDEVFDGGLLPVPEDQKTHQSCSRKEIPTAYVGEEVMKEQFDGPELLIASQTTNFLEDPFEGSQNMTTEDHRRSQLKAISEDGKSDGNAADEIFIVQTRDHSAGKQSQRKVVDDSDEEEDEHLQTINNGTSNSINLVDQTCREMSRLTSPESRDHDVPRREVESATKSDIKETCSIAKDGSHIETKNAFLYAKTNSSPELSKSSKSPRWTTKSRRAVEEWTEHREFNPREPNYLPMEPDADAEKVDLRHQMMDERKNAEEWMLDYALRQAVNKLAPARKRKVASLVEAFETVMPVPKWQTRLQNTSAAFAHSRPIQACS